MPEGGQLFVKTEVQSQEEITISFTDTGVGISEEDLSKLFEPLYTTKAKGIGLGLAICKTIIEKHKGIIEVKSEIKKGSTFSIKLPFGKKG
jgi:signal transduction histidine kinase